MLEDYYVELSKYLPRDIYMGESLEYLGYHSRVIDVNGKSKLHTIEYFALHILWMAFMQKVAFDLYRKDPDGVKAAFSSEGNMLRVLQDATVSYDLSVINEKKLCEICKHPEISFRHNKISNLRTLIDKRDHIAHCSGVLDLDQDEIEGLAKQCVRYTKEIHEKVKGNAVLSWSEFTQASQEQDNQYTLIHDAVVEHVSKQNYSVADIYHILEIKGEGTDIFEKIALFHAALYVEDYDINTEIDPEIYKNRALSAAVDDEERSKVQDEHEAYINFRIGLVKV